MLGGLGEFSLGDALINITGRVAPGLNKALGDAEGRVRKSLGNILGVASKVGAGMTVAGGAIIGALGFAAKGASDFDVAMREVNTLIGLSEADFKALSDQTIKLSSELGVDAVGATKALYQAISAGVPQDNAIDFMRVATKAAIAGVTETKTAVDGLSTVLNAFKLPMSDAALVADVMFTTVRTGKTTFDELSKSIFNVAPLAASTGVKFEEVTAAISTLTKQGVPTSVATTQIRAAIQGLIRPSEDMTKIFKAAGFESGELALKQIGLQKSLEIVTKATGGNKGELTKLLGSIEGVGAALGVTGASSQMFAGDLEAARAAAGASSKAYDEMNKSAARQYETLMVQLRNLRIEIGNKVLPVLMQLFERVKPVIFAITEWIQKNPELTGQIVMATGAIGGMMFAVGPLLYALPGLVTLVSQLGVMFKGVGLVLAGPVGLIVGLGLLVGAGGLMVHFSDTVHDWLNDKFPRLTVVLDTIGGTLADLGKSLWNIVKSVGELFGWLYKMSGLKWLIDKLFGDTGVVKIELGERAKAALADGKVPGLAGGGIARGGLAMIGERGPELAALPMGTRVVSSRESEAMLERAFSKALRGMAGAGPQGGAGSVTINVNAGRMTPDEAAGVFKMGLARLAEARG